MDEGMPTAVHMTKTAQPSQETEEPSGLQRAPVGFFISRPKPCEPVLLSVREAPGAQWSIHCAED